MRLRAVQRSVQRGPVHGLFGRETFPDGAILHWDADLDAFSEQTGGPHTFNHNVLSPQYQLGADGSYSDVGAKPAVDVFGGKKWLRSCGAVQNLLTNSVFAGAASGTPGTAPTGWSLLLNSGTTIVGGESIALSGVSARHGIAQTISLAANTTYRFSVQCVCDGISTMGSIMWTTNPPTGSVVSHELDGVAFGGTPSAGSHTVTLIVAVGATAGATTFRIGVGCDGPYTGSRTVTISNPQLTATAYPQPYVPTTAAGPVTQPASNATTTNGSWFSLPDGSPLWQALTGQPLTLATRVRMGVGSGDLAAGNNQIAGCNTSVSLQFFASDPSMVRAYDGVTQTPVINVAWSRNAIIRRVTQVNTAGTQFRVGYMIEGTNTSIQWSAWAAFDGSFGPSTLYRLMLGYNNAYPMWINKITAWKKQASDAEILEAMA